MIWLKYLLAIEGSHAESVVQCICHDEQIKALRKQRTVAGKEAFRDLGLVKHLSKSEKADARIRNRLRNLSETLGWPEGSGGKKGVLPPVNWIASKVNEQETYDLIYHATSRSVHFSPMELLRRAWYFPERKSITIDSKLFKEYWGHFSLHWGLWLFLGTALTVADRIEVDVDDPNHLLEAAKRIGEIGRPPIITADELYWGGGGPKG